jgi:bacteriocin-like protein
MTNETRELNINELDAVSGGLQRNPWKDAENQRIAAQNSGSNTVGGSLTDAANTFVFTGGTPGQGLGYKG